jgi:NADPH2:quinone reductase
VAAGDRVLVLGAAGGTGVAAIEIAKAAGATVIAAVSSEEKAAFARQCGADDAVVYPRGKLDKGQSKALADTFKAALGEFGADGADIVYDPVGGDYAEPALRSIAWKGRYLVVGFAAGIPTIPLNLALLKGCEIVGVFNGGFLAREPETAKANVRELLRLYEAGKIRPRVSARYPFERAREAIEHIAARGAIGKLVVEMPR